MGSWIKVEVGDNGLYTGWEFVGPEEGLGIMCLDEFGHNMGLRPTISIFLNAPFNLFIFSWFLKILPIIQYTKMIFEKYINAVQICSTRRINKHKINIVRDECSSLISLYYKDISNIYFLNYFLSIYKHFKRTQPSISLVEDPSIQR